MNPHKLVYGFAQGRTFNQWIAILTLTMWFCSKERKVPQLSGFVVLMGLFTLWITITTLLAPVYDVSYALWERNIKTFILVYLALCLVTNRARLHVFLWVYILSIGYWIARSGLATIVTGGQAVIYGPPGSMITDRNHLALAMAISLPVINYLRVHSKLKIVQFGLIGLMALSVFGIVGSFSRGGLISLGTVATFMWVKGKRRILFGVVSVFVLLASLSLVPDSYFDRASTIFTATEDQSFQGRLDAWTVAWQVSTDRLFGAGFDGPGQRQIWSQYSASTPRAAHSIYFMVLGDHGIIGLTLFLSMLLAAWLLVAKEKKLQRKSNKRQPWAYDLANAIQCSIITFMVGGAALSMSYYDGFMLLLAVGVVITPIASLERDPRTSQSDVKQPLLTGVLAPSRPSL